jgi:hypothetical protein
MALGSTQPLVKMSTRNIPGGKGGRYVRLTSPRLSAECHEIWEPKPPGTLWATPTCYGTALLISVKRLDRRQSHSAVGRIMSMRNSNDTIGNRTRDLPACSAVPQ